MTSLSQKLILNSKITTKKKTVVSLRVCKDGYT